MTTSINPSNADYHPLKPWDDDCDSTGVLARYRMAAALAHPPVCRCTYNSLENNTSSSTDNNASSLTEECVIGGILWKLQQFGRHQHGHSGHAKQTKFWCSFTLLMIVVTVPTTVCMLVLVDALTTKTAKDNLLVIQLPAEVRVCLAGVGLVAAFLLYFWGAKRLHRSFGISTAFRSKLDDFIEEICDELSPLDLELSQDTNHVEENSLVKLCGPTGDNMGNNIHLALTKKSDSIVKSLDRLPSVSSEFQQKMQDQQPLRETTIGVESLLPSGEEDPSFSKILPTLNIPLDDWITGGLKLRLRREQFRVSKTSRYVAYLVLAPLGILFLLHLAMRNHGEIHLPALLTGCFLTVVYWYTRECLDGSAVHRASRVVVQQFSNLAKERHGLTLQYEVQPADFLPRTTKGLIRFQPVLGEVEA